MVPLEALLKEEQEVLANAPNDPIFQAHKMYRDLPHLYHKPFIDLILSRGLTIRARDSHPPDLISRIGNEALQFGIGLLHDFDYNAAEDYQEIMQRVKELDRKYGVTITEEDVEKYLVDLSGRILDYATQKLGGLELAKPLRELFEFTEFIRFTQHGDWNEEKFPWHPIALAYLSNVKTFYEHANKPQNTG